jgi:hypothetical protein
VRSRKWVLIRDNFRRTVAAIKKYKLKVPFGTDAFGPSLDTMLNEVALRQRDFSNVVFIGQ